METAILIWIVATGLVLAGLAGLVLPLLPGAPLLFAGLLLAAWGEEFKYVSVTTLTILAALAASTYVLDFAATALGAKRFGSSNRAVIGAMVGALIGLFFALPGILLGPLIGAVIGEISAQRGLHAATRAGIGAVIGLVLGAAAKMAVAFSMLGLFAMARFF